MAERLMISDFMGCGWRAIVFERGRDGRAVARIGRLVVLPSREEVNRIQLGAPYRPESFIDKGRFLVALGLRPLGWSLSATATDRYAVGHVETALNHRVSFRVPLAEPVPETTQIVGDFIERDGQIVFRPHRCSCGEFASGWWGVEPKCRPCIDAALAATPRPTNAPNPFGEDISYAHSFEQEW